MNPPGDKASATRVPHTNRDLLTFIITCLNRIETTISRFWDIFHKNMSSCSTPTAAHVLMKYIYIYQHLDIWKQCDFNPPLIYSLWPEWLNEQTTTVCCISSSSSQAHAYFLNHFWLMLRSDHTNSTCFSIVWQIPSISSKYKHQEQRTGRVMWRHYSDVTSGMPQGTPTKSLAFLIWKPLPCLPWRFFCSHDLNFVDSLPRWHVRTRGSNV